VRECKGFVEEAADKEIIEAIRLLAKTEGIFAEPAGGVTVAVLKKLIDEGKIGPDETVVCFVTGGGLKTPELMVDGIKEARHVRPTLQSLKLIMGGI
jgi:L-threonine synthase (EC 4.2.3.1)